MERLTFGGNFCDIAQCESTPGGSYCESGSCSQRKVWERLKQYEDAEVKLSCIGWTVDRAAELIKADKEGRVVVLPCKVGDTVWVNGTKRTVQVAIDEMYFDDDQKGLQYLVSFACDLNCDGCPFAAWHQDVEGEHYCDGEWEQASIMGIDFGKSAFLTREEAEEALRRAENG